MTYFSVSIRFFLTWFVIGIVPAKFVWEQVATKKNPDNADLTIMGIVLVCLVGMIVSAIMAIWSYR